MLTYLEQQAVRSQLLHLIKSEHLGLAPHAEANLRLILQMNGFNLHQETLYGQYVSLTQRILWQRAGWDPDSEDEVDIFLRRDSVYKQDLLAPSQKNHFTPYFEGKKGKASLTPSLQNNDQDNDFNLANCSSVAYAAANMGNDFYSRMNPASAHFNADSNPLGFSRQFPQKKANPEIESNPTAVPTRQCDLPQKPKRKRRRRR